MEPSGMGWDHYEDCAEMLKKAKESGTLDKRSEEDLTRALKAMSTAIKLKEWNLANPEILTTLLNKHKQTLFMSEFFTFSTIFKILEKYDVKLNDSDCKALIEALDIFQKLVMNLGVFALSKFLDEKKLEGLMKQGE